MKDMVESPEYRHVPTGRLAILAQRLGRVLAAPGTWNRLVRERGWGRPRARVHPAKPTNSFFLLVSTEIAGSSAFSCFLACALMYTNCESRSAC